MKKEQDALIGIIRNYINNEPTKSIDVDWNVLYLLSRRHQITPIVYQQCKAFCPEEKFRIDFLHAVSRYVELTHEYNKLTTKFEDAGIAHFSVKGIDVARFYSIPSLRTMGDIDFIVPKRYEADQILIDMGYSICSHPEDHDWAYFKNGIEIELHDKFVYSQPINTPEIEEFFNNFDTFAQGNQLDHSFHFLYLILHLRKHFMNEGVGIRQFVDVAVMIRNCDGLNWSWIESALIKLKLDKFSEKVFALIRRWFCVEAPILRLEIDDSFFERAANKIMEDGVFGFCNEDNGKNATINSVKVYRRGRGLLEVVRRVFPTYDDMSSSEQYSFVKGKPFLIPFAWIYRFVYCINHKKISSGKKIIANANISKDDYLARKNELEQWGLA